VQVSHIGQILISHDLLDDDLAYIVQQTSHISLIRMWVVDRQSNAFGYRSHSQRVAPKLRFGKKIPRFIFLTEIIEHRKAQKQLL